MRTKHEYTRNYQILTLILLFFECGLSLEAAAQPRSGYYGSGIQIDVLNNAQVAEADVGYRFRATESSAVVSFIWWDVFRKGGSTALGCDGYGCGTGGSVDICIYNDDGKPNHLWAGKPIACVSDAKLRSGENIRTETFPVPAVLVAGNLYHLRWHNTDPDPARNFISVDDICVWHPTTPRQPTIPDTDLAVLGGIKVVDVDTDTPIFQLNYANGATQGQGYKEAWSYLPENISGAAKVREKFTVSGRSRIVNSVSVRVNRAVGFHDLAVTLATGSGSIIEQGTIPASNFPMGNALAPERSSRDVLPAWGTYVFSHAHTLSLGQSYLLTLSAPSDTVYQGYGIQRASGYNFTPGTFFGDGYGQFTHDNGSTWTGFRQSEVSVNHSDADIQFYFTTQ